MWRKGYDSAVSMIVTAECVFERQINPLTHHVVCSSSDLQALIETEKWPPLDSFGVSTLQ